MDEFDLDFDEVSEMNDIFRVTSRSNDRRICICGHAISRHKYDKFQNKHACKPGQLACPCINPRAVIEVPNTRYFMRKSHGSGSKHALAMGYAASKEAIGEEEFTEQVKWLVPAVCDICHKEAKYYPVRVTSTGRVLLETDTDEGVTAFLCAECRNPEINNA
jgi:hypothetical protein